MLREPKIHTHVGAVELPTGDVAALDPQHPWAFTDVACLICKKPLHKADNTNVQPWVETQRGGLCVQDFAEHAVDKDGLKDGYHVGTVPDVVEQVQRVHQVTMTEHGLCCHKCSAEAPVKVDVTPDNPKGLLYRVAWPCPPVRDAYKAADITPPA